MAASSELKRLGTQSAIYGLGGILSRLIAIFLLPVYTVYLGTVGFGKIETIVALTAVLTIVLRLGITSAFFRFYFDSDDEARRLLVVRTSFWFTMGMATLGLVVGFVCSREPISRLRSHVGRRPVARPRRLRRALGADELRADHGALPRRGAARRVRDRERRERADHDRRDDRARRRRAQGRDRRRGRQLPRHARRSTSSCSATAATSSASSSTAGCCAR